ncbi:MAG: hypothetical protein JXM69_11100 [Anaerolineae bacterium]|nr:hypothetical protein [Anaerolineae bacterium]
MQRPFGHILHLTFSLARPWLRLGPGWAALAGVLSARPAEFSLSTILPVLSLWLLVDPILGTLWDLSVQQGLWRTMAKAELGQTSRQGFFLPYAQPGSLAGRLALLLRRYQVWWGKDYWPEYGRRFISFWLGSILALLMALFLAPTIFGLVLLTLVLIILAGLSSSELTASQGGRLESLVMFLLPWAMGSGLWFPLSPLNLALAICFWVTYLGGLRMLGNHHRAGWLFYLGQIAAIGLLLSLRLLPGAAIGSVLLVTQQIIKTKFNSPLDFLQKVQPYLVAAVLVAGFALGSR